MQLRDHYLRTHDFNTRANLRCIDALRAAEPSIDDAIRIMGHVLNVEKVWFLRLEGFDTGAIATWPSLTLNECQELARISGETGGSFIRQLDDDALGQHVQYRTFKGDVFDNTIADILTHVSHHGAHHRGQINRMLREHGHPSAAVDFIGFARENGNR
jgi:uncharacterized damage-inducible protein DinB